MNGNQEWMAYVDLKASGRLKAKRKPPTYTGEAGIQTKVVEWARMEGLFLFSIPNQGERTMWGSMKEKAMGLLPGACDLFLSMPNGRYHGFYIEMKSPKQKPRENQVAFMEMAKKNGYAVDWFDDADKAIQSIKEYMGLNNEDKQVL